MEPTNKLIRVAVYSLEVENIPKGVAQIVTDNLLAEVRKLEGVSAIGMEEIYEMLQHEKSRQVMGCEADDACLAEIAGALGVDELITGKLSSLADGSVMVLRRINQREAKITATFNERLKPAEGVEFLAAIGDAVKQVYPGRDVCLAPSAVYPKRLVVNYRRLPFRLGQPMQRVGQSLFGWCTGRYLRSHGLKQPAQPQHGAIQHPKPDERRLCGL